MFCFIIYTLIFTSNFCRKLNYLFTMYSVSCRSVFPASLRNANGYTELSDRLICVWGHDVSKDGSYTFLAKICEGRPCTICSYICIDMFFWQQTFYSTPCPFS